MSASHASSWKRRSDLAKRVVDIKRDAAMALLTACLTLGYQLAPAVPPTSARRAATPLMEEARLNNYVLPGPMTPLGNQVRELRREQSTWPLHLSRA